MTTFEQVYNSLENDLDQVEKVRKKALVKKYIANIFSILIIVVISMYLRRAEIIDLVTFFRGLIGYYRQIIADFPHSINLGLIKENIFIVFVAFFTYVVLQILIFLPVEMLVSRFYNSLYNKGGQHSDDFYLEYKLKIIRKIIDSFGYDLDYSFLNHIDEKYITESQLFPNDIKKYEGDDYVEGHIGKTKIKFSEIKIWKCKGKNSSEKCFQGIFFVADFHKKFSGTTIIKGRGRFPLSKYISFSNLLIAISFFNLFLSGSFGIIFFIGLGIVASYLLYKIRLKRKKLEDQDFEKVYNVYGEDSQEVHYLLTPDMMKRLTELQVKTDSVINISLVNSKIFLAIPFKTNLFEAKLGHSVNKKKTLSRYYQILEVVLGIVEELNLNTRIWTKE